VKDSEGQDHYYRTMSDGFCVRPRYPCQCFGNGHQIISIFV